MTSRLVDIIHNLLGEKNFNDWKIKSEKWKDSNIKFPKKIKSKGDVTFNTYIFRTEPTISNHSPEILHNEGIFVSEDLAEIEGAMLSENKDDKALLYEFDLYCESQHYDALRLAIASQKLHESGDDAKSIRILDIIRKKYGTEGNTIYNLYISSIMKTIVISALNTYKLALNNVNDIRNRFLPEFKELLVDYDYVIFVGVNKTTQMIIREIKEKYQHRVNHISIYSREAIHNQKVDKALEKFQENPKNPKIKIEKFENEYFLIANAQNYRIYFLERIEQKLSRKARKRYKKAKKKRKKQ
jgi:hypothetical protein